MNYSSPLSSPSAGYSRSPWNKGKIIGPRPPLRPGHVWSIRAKLYLELRIRDLALFNLAIDSKLRGCDHVALRVDDVAPHGYAIGPRQRAPEQNRSAGAVRIDRADARVSRRVSAQQRSQAGAGSVFGSRRLRSISDDAAVRAPSGRFPSLPPSRWRLHELAGLAYGWWRTRTIDLASCRGWFIPLMQTNFVASSALATCTTRLILAEVCPFPWLGFSISS